MRIVCNGIDGGFVAIDARELGHAWTTCQRGGPGVGGFRAYLACREMVARRGVGGHGVGGDDDRVPRFEPTELAQLLGVATRTAATLVRRLVAAGLLIWSDTAITFPAVTAPDGGRFTETIGRGVGLVAIPRRLLRFLVRGARAALIATALGALLRCVSRRRTGFGVWGRFKASWIARVFGVAERHARAARAELVQLGWLEPDPSETAGQWAWNRWGRAFRVRLDWRAPRSDCPTLPTESCASSSYPFLKPGSSPERKENPEPAPSGPAGACAGTGNTPAEVVPPLRDPASEITPTGVPKLDGVLQRIAAAQRPEGSTAMATRRPDPAPTRPPVSSPNFREAREQTPASDRPLTGEAALPSPTLRNIKPADLADIGRVLTLHAQAVASGRISPSEADRLNFVAAAEHARALGWINPPGLLARIVTDGLWRVITQADEDQARKRLREHHRASPT